MLNLVNLIIVIGAGLVVLSALTSLVSRRLGVPILLVFLGIGLLVGVDGPGGISFDNTPLAYFIGSLAMGLILFDAGFETPWSTWRAAGGPGVVLASLGVLATAGMVAAVAVPLLGVDWSTGLLLGAIVASTDAAAVFLLLRMSGVVLRERVRATLEIESGSNDPVAVFLALGLVVLTGTPHVSDAIGMSMDFAQQLSIGALGGLAAGFGILKLLNAIELEEGLYPVVVGGLALSTFSLVNLAGGSGFLAAYIAGLVVGNGRLHARAEVQRFQSTMTWLCQIALFLTLGLLATPSEFGDVIVPASIIAAALIFLGRPIAVWLSLLPFGFNRREMTFISWVGLRGAVSILLAIVPLLSNHPQGQLLFNTAFVIVLISLLVQGWTVRPMAKLLRLTIPPRQGPLHRVELTLPGNSPMEMIAYRVHPESPVARGSALPRWARPSLVIRDGRAIPAHGIAMKGGDQVYLFAAPQQVGLIDRLFAGTAEITIEDRDFYGDFQLPAGTRLSQLAHVYGLRLPKDFDGSEALGQLFVERFGSAVEAGDRIDLGALVLVLIDVEEGQPKLVGLLLDPAPPPREVPFLPSGAEIRNWFRRSKPLPMLENGHDEKPK